MLMMPHMHHSIHICTRTNNNAQHNFRSDTLEIGKVRARHGATIAKQLVCVYTAVTAQYVFSHASIRIPYDDSELPVCTYAGATAKYLFLACMRMHALRHACLGYPYGRVKCIVTHSHHYRANAAVAATMLHESATWGNQTHTVDTNNLSNKKCHPGPLTFSQHFE